MSHHSMAPRTANTAISNATSGSQTILQTEAQSSDQTPSATLRLRAEPVEQPHVRWAQDVVDNEGMGKKSSKVCCIYHKPREPGESDSDSDSSSSSDDGDDEPDLSRAQRSGGSERRGGRSHDVGKTGRNKERKPSPNAYERQPKPRSKKDG